MSHSFVERFLAHGVFPGEVALFWLEQNHFLLKTSAGRAIHIDPFVSREVIPVERFIHSEPVAKAGELPADCVFLTHDHADHADRGTIAPLAWANPQCRFVGPAEAIERCRACGVSEVNMIAVAEGEERAFDGITVRAVFAQSTSAQDDTPHLGFVLRVDGLTLYNVGDTRVRPEEYAGRLEAVRNLRPDVMMVPINGGFNNPGPAGAAWLVEWVNPRRIVPCHYGCFRNNTIDPVEFIETLPVSRRGSVCRMDRGAVLVLKSAER